MVYLVARLFCGVRTVLSFYGLRRHPPVFFPREQARFLVSLRSRSPPALSERDHLFTGRCDLVIPPLSRDLPRSPLNSGRKSAHRRRRMKKAAALLESNDLAESARGRWTWKREEEGERDHDEVVKSVERLKIIQGSTLRADALTTLTCPHLFAYDVPVTPRYLAYPRPRGARRIVGGFTESRGLWDRISRLSTHLATSLQKLRRDRNKTSTRCTVDVSFHGRLLKYYTKHCDKIRRFDDTMASTTMPRVLNGRIFRMLRAHFRLNNRLDSLWKNV